MKFSGRDAERTRQTLTAVLEQWSRGEDNIADEAMPVVYDELRRLAQSLLNRERPGHTLQATALVNEVYLRLHEETGVCFENRAHFIGRVAFMMRRLLIDYARERNAQKRGADFQRVTLADVGSGRQKSTDLVALDDALLSLERKDPRMARLVELRYFGGLTLEETAEVLGISRASVVLAWRRTKVWLHRELKAG
jgi:RNA polymerase sigma factor (TIGR02999 family)